VAEPHLPQSGEALADSRNALEQLVGFVHGEIERIGDGEAAIAHLERLAVVTPSRARVARRVHVGKEMHFDAQHAVSLARLATASLHVERETAWLVSAGARVRQPRVELAEVREDPGVRRGIRARRAPNRGLVDADDLVDVLEPFDAIAGSDPARCAIELRANGREERV